MGAGGCGASAIAKSVTRTLRDVAWAWDVSGGARRGVRVGGDMTRSRVYDLLLITFILAVLWAGVLNGVLPPLATHASNFGVVGLVSLLLIRPRRFGSAAATGRVVTTAALVALVAALVELLVGTNTLLVGSSGTTLKFTNVQDGRDAAAGLLAAFLVVLVHGRLARRDAEEERVPSRAAR